MKNLPLGFLSFALLTAHLFLAGEPAAAQISVGKNQSQLTPAVRHLSDLSSGSAAKSLVSGNDLLRRTQPFFERNDGQFDPQILFFTRGNGYSVLLEHDGIALLKNSKSTVTRLRLIGGATNAKVQGEDTIPGISNYFSGTDPAKWITHVPHFASVRYHQVYPGIDLVFYFKDRHLEYDFAIAPGANARAIRIGIEGAEPLLTRSGEVVITADGMELVRSKMPRAYTRSGRNSIVPVRYVLHGKEVGFAVGSYNRQRSLVIDPALTFATFVMGNCLPNSSFPNCTDDSLVEMAADKTGVYLAGSTTATTFPSVAGQPPVAQGTGRGYVIKLDPTLTHVLYSTFISGLIPESLAIDAAGEAFVSGDATTGFPTTPGAFNSSVPICTICNFPGVSKLSSDGATMVYSTLLMASDTNSTQDDPTPGRTVVDADGNLYLLGQISPQIHTIPLRFPTTVGSFQPTRINPGGDDFVMKLNPTGSALVYSTYLHPNKSDNQPYEIDDLAIDSSGAAYVTGFAGPNFPTTSGAYQETTTTPTAFLSKLSADGSSLVYSTFFGATVGRSVAVDSSGQAVIAGTATANLPLAGALCSNDPQLISQGFITKFNSTGSALVYSTGVCTLNPALSGEASVALDSTGAAYVLGTFELNGGAPSFPLLNPVQSYLLTGTAFTIIKLDSSGVEQFGTFLGDEVGPGNDRIRLDGTGALYVLANDLNFPTTPNSLQPVNVDPGGVQSPFVAKIVPSLGMAVPVVSPAAVSFPNSQVTGSSSAPFDVIVANFGDADMSSAPVISATGDFSQTNNCSGPVLAAQKCDIQVVFTPTAAGTRTGTLTVKFTGFPDQTIPLTGVATAPVVALSSALLAFPPEPVGTASPAETLTVSNVGTGPLNINTVQITGDFAQTNPCGNPVLVGSSCTVQITFKPTAQGKRLGMVTLVDNDPAGSAKVSLVGFGGQSAGVSLSPQHLNFSGQIVGTSSSAMTVTVTNVGNLSLNVTSVGVTGDYSQTNTCSSAIAPSGTCTIQVNFSPTASGARNGLLTITDNSFTSPETVIVTGTGSDFSFGVAASSSSTATITAGQTANYTLTASPTANAGGTLNFTCQGAPALSSCTVTPPSLTLNNAAQNVTVSISTTAAGFTGPGTLDQNNKTGPLPLLLCLLIVSLIFIALRQKRLRWSLAPLALFLLCTGCGGGGGGGGGSGGTPRGTFTIVVTATPGAAGAASHTMNLTLNVQ